MAELSAAADRAHVVQHLEAASRWLELLSSRLADGGEAEAAALTDAAWADIDAVCARLRTTSGLPVDPHRASTPHRRWPAAASRRADAVGISARFPVPGSAGGRGDHAGMPTGVQRLVP